MVCITFKPPGTWRCWVSITLWVSMPSQPPISSYHRKTSDSHRHPEPQFTTQPGELPAKCGIIPPEHWAGGEPQPTWCCHGDAVCHKQDTKYRPDSETVSARQYQNPGLFPKQHGFFCDPGPALVCFFLWAPIPPPPTPNPQNETLERRELNSGCMV